MSDPAAAIRDIAGIGRWATILLLANAGLAVAMVAAALSYGPGFMEASEAYLMIGVLAAAALLVTGVVFLRWTWLTAINARAFGAQALRYGPTLSWASYFIPLANLGLPLQALRDIWKASVEPRDWEIVPIPAVFAFWWAFWLLSNFSGVFALALDDGIRAPGMNTAEMLTMTADVASALASLLLAWIVHQLTALQRDRALLQVF